MIAISDGGGDGYKVLRAINKRSEDFLGRRSSLHNVHIQISLFRFIFSLLQTTDSLLGVFFLCKPFLLFSRIRSDCIYTKGGNSELIS